MLRRGCCCLLEFIQLLQQQSQHQEPSDMISSPTLKERQKVLRQLLMRGMCWEFILPLGFMASKQYLTDSSKVTSFITILSRLAWNRGAEFSGGYSADLLDMMGWIIIVMSMSEASESSVNETQPSGPSQAVNLRLIRDLQEERQNAFRLMESNIKLSSQVALLQEELCELKGLIKKDFFDRAYTIKELKTHQGVLQRLESTEVINRELENWRIEAESQLHQLALKLQTSDFEVSNLTTQIQMYEEKILANDEKVQALETQLVKKDAQLSLAQTQISEIKVTFKEQIQLEQLHENPQLLKEVVTGSDFFVLVRFYLKSLRTAEETIAQLETQLKAFEITKSDLASVAQLRKSLEVELQKSSKEISHLQKLYRDKCAMCANQKSQLLRQFDSVLTQRVSAANEGHVRMQAKKDKIIQELLNLIKLKNSRLSDEANSIIKKHGSS